MFSSTSVKIAVSALFILLLGMVVALSVGFSYLLSQNYTETQRIDQAVQSRTEHLCNFFGPLATIPPPPQTTKVGTQILIGSIEAYNGLGCSATRIHPSPDLIKDARKFGVPVSK